MLSLPGPVRCPGVDFSMWDLRPGACGVVGKEGRSHPLPFGELPRQVGFSEPHLGNIPSWRRGRGGFGAVPGWMRVLRNSPPAPQSQPRAEELWDEKSPSLGVPALWAILPPLLSWEIPGVKGAPEGFQKQEKAGFSIWDWGLPTSCPWADLEHAHGKVHPCQAFVCFLLQGEKWDRIKRSGQQETLPEGRVGKHIPKAPSINIFWEEKEKNSPCLVSPPLAAPSSHGNSCGGGRESRIWLCRDILEGKAAQGTGMRPPRSTLSRQRCSRSLPGSGGEGRGGSSVCFPRHGSVSRKICPFTVAPAKCQRMPNARSHKRSAQERLHKSGSG